MPKVIHIGSDQDSEHNDQDQDAKSEVDKNEAETEGESRKEKPKYISDGPTSHIPFRRKAITEPLPESDDEQQSPQDDADVPRAQRSDVRPTRSRTVPDGTSERGGKATPDGTQRTGHRRKRSTRGAPSDPPYAQIGLGIAFVAAAYYLLSGPNHPGEQKPSGDSAQDDFGF
jgi:hypothetical protein